MTRPCVCQVLKYSHEEIEAEGVWNGRRKEKETSEHSNFWQTETAVRRALHADVARWHNGGAWEGDDHDERFFLFCKLFRSFCLFVVRLLLGTKLTVLHHVLHSYDMFALY